MAPPGKKGSVTKVAEVPMKLKDKSGTGASEMNFLELDTELPKTTSVK